MVKKILLIIVLTGLIVSLFGCATVQGIGKDIQTVGEAGEKAVK